MSEAISLRKNTVGVLLVQGEAMKSILLAGFLIVSPSAFPWSGSIIKDYSCFSSSDSLVAQGYETINSYLEMEQVSKASIAGISVTLRDVPIDPVAAPCRTSKVASCLYDVRPEKKYPDFFVQFIFSRRNESLSQGEMALFGLKIAEAFCPSGPFQVSPWKQLDKVVPEIEASFSCSDWN